VVVVVLPASLTLSLPMGSMCGHRLTAGDRRVGRQKEEPLLKVVDSREGVGLVHAQKGTGNTEGGDKVKEE